MSFTPMRPPARIPTGVIPSMPGRMPSLQLPPGAPGAFGRPAAPMVARPVINRLAASIARLPR
jgi:hypothetical protein